MNCITTTIRKHSIPAEQLARNLAGTLQVPYVERDNLSLDALRRRFDVDNIIVATQSHPIVSTLGGNYFFHLSMAELRIKNLINGNYDHMSTAMALAPGRTVLDCTLGLATDAVVASYIVGNSGQVVGLEITAIIAAVTALGLQQFTNSGIDPAIIAALRRIKVYHTDCLTYLRELPNNSFDVVYFDPMFRHPVTDSANLNPLRRLADAAPLNLSSIREACRVAALRVVVKEANGSPEFARLGIASLLGGKYSSIQYGIIETGGTAWNE